ncbi:Predicted membrane protein [Mycobacteroides abscessus subsp. abscessus]|nr:Predicted membrane protein [Mycobacteroides abscessus subsp. abscessus]
MEHWDPSVMFRTVDIAAVAANGLLGGAVARAFRFDIVGFVMLAIVSGMGGGMIRDVLLNSGFPVALTDAGYWVGVLAAAAVAYTIDLGSRWADRLLIVLDFVGMGAWTATGTLKALGQVPARRRADRRRRPPPASLTWAARRIPSTDRPDQTDRPDPEGDRPWSTGTPA